MTEPIDTAKCIRDGVHHITQRHPHTECPAPDPAPYRARPDKEILRVADLHRVEYGGELDGSEPQVDNETRASFAAAAVIAYGRATRSEDEPVETTMSDLMGDLQHLLDVLAESGEDGGEFPNLEGLIDRGSVHYEAEIRGEF